MLELGVNIDHIATLREARKTDEPDPVWAAVEAELGGADGITVHLREDRRHINDDDVRRLRQSVHCKLNCELSLAEEIVEIIAEVAPDQATLVPERRQEITTEGGLDLVAHDARVRMALDRLRGHGVQYISAFLDPSEAQIRRAAEQGFDAVELHTGSYANAKGADQSAELENLIEAGSLIRSLGLRLHAGHGLNYLNTPPVAAITGMAELNIGHAIISRAVLTGLRHAVREMKDLMLHHARPT